MRKTTLVPLTESATDTERDFSTKKRADMDLADFGDPDKRAFPVLNQSDLDNAARLIGHADNPEAVKQRLIAIAKRKGLSLPDSWKDDGKKESISTESAASSSLPFSPKSKIATLTTCWLEDGAISLNGRQYPREAVDRLIQSAQIQLSSPGSLPLTSYISHDAADQDDSLKLVGKVTSVWREGARAMASIDLANTQAGRDAATLAANGYLCTQSLRASNAEVRREKDSVWPTVGGANLHLDGIDFTATPGIAVAKIQNVALAESASTGPQRINEVFNAHAHTLTENERKETPMKIDEADQGGNTVGGYSPTSGNTVGVTSDPTDDAYHQSQYKQPPMTSGPMQGMDKAGSAIDVQEAHDRIAMVQGRSCAPGRESAAWKIAFAGLSEGERKLVEAGRAISSRNDAHLDAAHHAVARVLGKECEGKNNKMGSAQPADDGMQDGDDDDRQSSRPKAGLKEKHMTPDEAAKLLEAAGYTIQKPKTEAESLREQMTVLQEKQSQELAELRAMIQGNQAAPQRKSVVLGANVGPQSNRANVYQPGKYLREQIQHADWSMLADRTAPLPENIDLTLLIREFTDLRVIQNFDRYGWPENLANAVDRL